MYSFVVPTVIFVFCLSCTTGAPSISERQSPGTSCVQNSDCNPEEFANITIPVTFVECIQETGRCSCSDCFMRNDEENRCYVDPPCTEYNPANNECSDNRKNTLTAFLLTFFLIPTGAANFYIDRLEFAIPQLILGVIYLVFQCCIMPCVRRCAKDAKENEDLGKGLLSCCLCIPYCLLAWLFFAWWIADLVIFGTNQREDGDGCSLRDNL